MALRELLAQFDVGVNTSQLVRADSLIAAVAQRAASLSGVIAGASGKVARVDVDASALSGFTGILEKAKAAAGAFFTLQGAESLASGFGELIEEGGKLNDLSDKLGVGTDELQKFAYATSLAGVEGEKAFAGLGKLQRNLGNAIGGDKGAVQAFADIGVAFQDSGKQARPLIDIAEDVADAVKGSGSEAEAAAKLTKLFGKSGADLIPAFKDGGQAIRDLAEEYDALGGGMSKDFVAAADEVDDQLTRLRFAKKSLGIAIAREVLPYAQKLLKWAVEAVKDFRAFTKNTNIVKVALIAMGTAGAGFATFQLYGLAKALGFVSAQSSGAGSAIKGIFSLGITGSALLIGFTILVGLVEDFYTLLTGGDSVIGDFLDKTQGVGASAAFVKEFKDAWEELNETFKDPAFAGVKESLGEIGKSILPTVVEKFINVVRLSSAFAKALSAALTSAKAIAGIVESLSPTGLALAAGNALGGQKTQTSDLFKKDEKSQGIALRAVGALSNAGSKFGEAKQLALASAGLVNGEDGGGFARRGPVPTAEAAKPIAGGAAAGLVGSLQQTNKIEINVNGGATNAETGGIVADATKSALSQTGLGNALAAVTRR